MHDYFPWDVSKAQMSTLTTPIQSDTVVLASKIVYSQKSWLANVENMKEYAKQSSYKSVYQFNRIQGQYRKQQKSAIYSSSGQLQWRI